MGEEGGYKERLCFTHIPFLFVLPSFISLTNHSLLSLQDMKAASPLPQITQDFLVKDSITVYFAPSEEECKGEQGKRAQHGKGFEIADLQLI